MEAILKFSLPEEQNEHELAINASKWYVTLWDVDQHLRALLKYGANGGVKMEDLKTADEALSSVRDFIHTTMEDQGIRFD